MTKKTTEPKQSLESIYLKYQDKIEKLRLKHVIKPVTHKNLSLVDFVDENGKHFYAHPKDGNMSIDRMGALRNFTQYLSKGLTSEEDDAIDDAIADTLPTMKNAEAKGVVRISVLLDERKRRKKLCFHTLVFYNILAVQWVREDESVYEFDETIQFEKVQSFIQADKEHTGFFFHQPELKGLLSLLRITHEDVPSYLKESVSQAKVLAEKLAVINSYGTKSKEDKTTLEKKSWYLPKGRPLSSMK